MLEINYDAGRKQQTYIAQDIAFNSFPKKENGGPILFHVVLAVIQRYRTVQQMFDRLSDLHRKRLDPNPLDGSLGGAEPSEFTTGNPSNQYEYHFATEAWVFQMRRTLDTLVQYVEVVTSLPSVPGRLAYDSIASVLHQNADSSTDVYRIILGDNGCLRRDPTDFLNIVNDLFNSMKHCLLHEESQNLFCPDPNTPSIVSFYVKYNRLADEPTYHNHNAFHIMMGFQDTVERILINLNRFFSNNSEN